MEKLPLNQLNFEQFLFCPKCHFIIENPYEIECCGTLYCYMCIELNINKNIEDCGKCGKVAIYRQNCFVKRIANQMQILCNYGCGTKLRTPEMKSHMLNCEKRIFTCNICKIQNNIKESIFLSNKKEFLEHMLDYHSKELVTINDNFHKFSNVFDKDINKKLRYISLLDDRKSNMLLI
jgi:hypothetical protein